MSVGGVLKIRSCGYQGMLVFSDTIKDRGKGGQGHKVSIHGLKSSLVAIPVFFFLFLPIFGMLDLR